MLLRSVTIACLAGAPQALVLRARPKLWLLDRDGCINQDVGPPGVVNVDDLALIPGSAGALRRLRLAGPVAIVTNQSCRGKGLLSAEDLQTIHERLRHLIAKTARGGRVGREQWDAMYICEDANDGSRKKPEPGMLLEACREFECDPSAALMIGDSWGDVVAAHRAGCHGVLVTTGHGESLGAAVRSVGMPLPTTLTANSFNAAARTTQSVAHGAAHGAAYSAAQGEGTPSALATPALDGWMRGRDAREAALIHEALRSPGGVRVYRDLAQAVDELTAPPSSPPSPPSLSPPSPPSPCRAPQPSMLASASSFIDMSPLKAAMLVKSWQGLLQEVDQKVGVVPELGTTSAGVKRFGPEVNCNCNLNLNISLNRNGNLNLDCNLDGTLNRDHNLNCNLNRNRNRNLNLNLNRNRNRNRNIDLDVNLRLDLDLDLNLNLNLNLRPGARAAHSLRAAV